LLAFCEVTNFVSAKKHLINVFSRSSHDDVKTVLNMLMSKLLLDKTSLGVKVQTLVLHMLIKCWQKSWNELTKSIVTSKSLKGSNFLKKMRESYKADMGMKPVTCKTLFAELVVRCFPCLERLL